MDQFSSVAFVMDSLKGKIVIQTNDEWSCGVSTKSKVGLRNLHIYVH